MVLMTDICREMGVRTDVPFRELTKQEKGIVFHGPAVKKHSLPSEKSDSTTLQNWILPI
ncbi:MAG: hypothetical protein ACLURV_13510 [Gallintestinimicrobium sp.]